jgi:hypothetical protein
MHGRYGDVVSKAATEMAKPEVAEHFAALIGRVVPKHHDQCMGEVKTVTRWFVIFVPGMPTQHIIPSCQLSTPSWHVNSAHYPSTPTQHII